MVHQSLNTLFPTEKLKVSTHDILESICPENRKMYLTVQQQTGMTIMDEFHDLKSFFQPKGFYDSKY